MKMLADDVLRLTITINIQNDAPLQTQTPRLNLYLSTASSTTVCYATDAV